MDSLLPDRDLLLSRQVIYRDRLPFRFHTTLYKLSFHDRRGFPAAWSSGIPSTVHTGEGEGSELAEYSRSEGDLA